ncbi:MAG: Acetyl coenzyme A synthase alpha subunit [Candidatus Moranbacteria bacterium GW2011_GWF1_35_5]|nr:MAG: Acetyl coenzyme A synthase alpha subunit [Candidatus Moranbacteria bacterium GW2011_GWF1_35_5]
MGASDKAGSVGNAITQNLLNLGYAGEVFLINPKYPELSGQKCYASLNDVEKEIDLAIIVIPATFVNETIKLAKNVKNFIVISAGFSEIGKEGRLKELELLKIAKENNVNILGPNCLGLIIPKLNLNASFAGGMPKSGGVSLISQSGALVVAMMDMANERQIKFSQIISVGNKMQLDETELMEYLANDKETKVIALYLEGIKDGQKFIEVAKKISQKKPIIVLKAGISEKAQKAIASHTGSLAGSDEIMNAAFAKAGIIRAESLEDFFILITLVANFKNNVSGESVIITNAGGPGVLATDAFGGKKIKLKEFSAEAKEKLREFLPAESSVENPIDLLGDATQERYQKTLELLEGEDVGDVLCLMTAQDQTPTEKIAQVIADFKEKSQKNIIPVFIGGEKIKKAVEILAENNIPNFNFPKEVIDGLEKALEKKEIFETSKSLLGKLFGAKDKNIINIALAEKKKALLFGKAGELMQKYSIPVVDFVSLAPGQELGEILVKFPVVLKVDSENVLHKTEKRGLVLGIKNMEELQKAVAEMKNNFAEENLIIQPMLEYATELIVGLKRDLVFGPVIVFGLGGIYTEVFKMVDFLILPLGKDEIEKRIMESKVGFLFTETRGKKVGDLEEITEFIFNFARLAEEQEEIKEIDINPLLITNEGKLVAVDVKVIL